MRYDANRRRGLPLMSNPVESTIKQINYRVTAIMGKRRYRCSA